MVLLPDARVIVTDRQGVRSTVSGEVVTTQRIDGELVSVLIRKDVGGYEMFDLETYEVEHASF